MISLQNLKFTSSHANTEDASTHEYLNIEMVNEYSTVNTEPLPIIFQQVKAANIVNDVGDYFLSVVRWNIQSNLPVLVPDMLLYPALHAPTFHTQYKLILLYSVGTLSGSKTFINPDVNNVGFVVDYEPEIFNQNIVNSIFAPTSREQVLNNPYYYIKSVDTFLRMLNNTITTNIATIGATWTKPPYFEWDAQSQKIVYNRPNSTPVLAGVSADASWYIAVNQPLYNLLNTFRFEYFPINSGNDQWYPSNIETRYLLNNDILPTTALSVGDYSPYTQQASSVVNWSPAEAIVFSSGTIPVEPQMSGAPTNLNLINPSTSSNIYAQQGITKVLTDFSIPFTSGVEATNQYIYYTPTSEYRLIDLIGSNNLNQLTISVSWRDKYGVLHPMTLDAGANASLLIMLRKKKFNNIKNVFNS